MLINMVTTGGQMLQSAAVMLHQLCGAVCAPAEQDYNAGS